MEKSVKKHLREPNIPILIGKGFCMGIADIIPGISGGTIAFIMGIYEELIEAIRSFDIVFIRRALSFRLSEAFGAVYWRFLGAVVLGIGAAIIIMSRLISWLIVNYPVHLNAFFFGLILATVPIIATIIKRWNYGKVFAVLLAAAVTYCVVDMTPLQTPTSYWFLFLTGFVAISAMILPGISGAFILVLLGKYHFILEAINSYDLIPLTVFGLGVITGIISFVRLLGFLLHKCHDLTVAVLTGVVIGSLNKIWPWKETIQVIEGRHGKIIPVEQMNVLPAHFDLHLLTAIIVMAFGFLLALVLNFSHSKETLRV